MVSVGSEWRSRFSIAVRHKRSKVLITVLLAASPLLAQTRQDFSFSSLSLLQGDSSGSAADTQALAASSSVDPGTASAGHIDSRLPERRNLQKADRNRSVFYKNKWEFAFDSGRYPTNIPFPFDFLLGDGYNMTPLKYTLVPFIFSARWQIGNIKGPAVLRGNWEMSFGGTYTMIPRGPETRFFAYVMGVRRNFVPRNWRVTPYLDGRVGAGDINAKEPKGATWAQGQDFTFTLMLGAGARYNINPRWAFSAGMGYMHVSNLYLSEPKYLNYGINVYGPTAGIDIRIGKEKRQESAELTDMR